MPKSLLAALAVVGSLALTLPAADAGAPTTTGTTGGPASLLPVGSLWDVGSGAAPDCETVTAPPPAPAGTAPILTGRPGGPTQWCWAFARVSPGGVQLPGGIAGEWLSPDQYAIETGSTVTVIHNAGRVVVYVSD